MQLATVIRYFEKTLGLKQIDRDFFVSGSPAVNPGLNAMTERQGRYCTLVLRESLERPSLKEMAERLKAAIEGEFKSRGLLGMKVQWETANQPTLTAKPDLRIEFGSDFNPNMNPNMNPHFSADSPRTIKLPRLDELHDNPVAKKAAWKQIQTAIARVADQTLV